MDVHEKHFYGTPLARNRMVDGYFRCDCRNFASIISFWSFQLAAFGFLNTELYGL
jgi:hypothetical protein